jgi:hypothetical protein
MTIYFLYSPSKDFAKSTLVPMLNNDEISVNSLPRDTIAKSRVRMRQKLSDPRRFFSFSAVVLYFSAYVVPQPEIIQRTLILLISYSIVSLKNDIRFF